MYKRRTLTPRERILQPHYCIPNLRKTPPCPDQTWLATNIISCLDISTDTSLSDKTVFAHSVLPWERMVLRKSGKQARQPNVRSRDCACIKCLELSA